MGPTYRCSRVPAMARPGNCECSRSVGGSSSSSRRSGIVRKIGIYYFFALLTFALFSIGTASWVDEHASKPGINPTEQAVVRINERYHEQSGKAFVFDDTSIDKEIVKHVTVLFTARESTEYFAQGLRKVPDLYPPGIQFVVVTCGNKIDRTQRKQEITKYPDLNMTYLEMEDEYVSINSLRKVGLAHVTTDYVLYSSFDTHAWVTRSEHPLDWLRILFDVARFADDSLAAFAPALASRLFPSDPEHTWKGLGPRAAGNVDTHVPLKARNGSWVRDAAAVRRLSATLLEQADNHLFLVRSRHVPDMLRHTETEAANASQCAAYEVDKYYYHHLPKGVYMLHVPWTHAVFNAPQTYITWRSLPYYSYIMGQDCTMQAQHRQQAEAAASRSPVVRMESLEFTDVLFMQMCDWGRESPYYARREESIMCGGVLPPDRSTQLKILVSALSIFRYNVFEVNHAPHRYVAAQRALDAMAHDASDKGMMLSTSRHYDFPKCMNAAEMEGDGAAACFEAYTPVTVVVATVRNTSGLGAYSACLREILGQQAFLVTEADGGKGKGVASKQQHFFHVSSPGSNRRVDAAHDLFSNFTGVWAEASAHAATSNLSTVAELWRYYKKTTQNHKNPSSVCYTYKYPVTKTEQAFRLHFKVHVCSAAQAGAGACRIDMSIAKSWSLEQVRHSPIHGGETIVNRFLMDKYKLHKM
jgi:hypothetical protein